MATYLLVWNPERYFWENFDDIVDTVVEKGFVDGQWSCGNTKRIVKGDRLFMMRVGSVDPGLIGSGTATSKPRSDDHWEADPSHPMRKALYIGIKWEFLSSEALITRNELRAPPFSSVHWSSQISGISINQTVARSLEAEWAERMVPYRAKRATKPAKMDATKFQKLLDLDSKYKAWHRREQSKIKRSLLGGAEAASCAFCGQDFPVDLLFAAHIRRRADCTYREKRDYSNNVILLCKFGCDDLFERGYLVVRNGKLDAGRISPTSAVITKVSFMRGKRVMCWGEKSARYFDAHRNRSAEPFDD